MRQPLPVLLLAATLLGSGAASAAGPSGDAPQAAPRAGALTPPLPIGVEADVYCTGWIEEPDAAFPATIFSAELINSKQGFFEGDVVYVSGGANQGFAAGQEFWIVRPGRIVHPVHSVLDVVGRVYQTPGRIRILCAQENSSIAEIVLSCSDTNIGDAVLPFEAIPIPLVRRTAPLSSCDPTSGKVSGHIVADFDDVTAIATGSVVYLDRGEDDGLVPGDFLSVFRLPTEDRRLQTILGHGDTAAEREVRTMLGEAAILTTRKKTSVAIITTMRDTMYVGDRVELK
jgi:hypothetical protein